MTASAACIDTNIVANKPPFGSRGEPETPSAFVEMLDRPDIEPRRRGELIVVASLIRHKHRLRHGASGQDCPEGPDEDWLRHFRE
jgi:hypothetical protein